MAEVVGVLGLIASILGILEGIEKSKTILKKYVHSSSSLRAELVPLLGKLTAFAGLLRGLQLECELDESDNGRLHVFAHIQEPLEHSKRAAQTIVARLNQVISVGSISLSFGKILNKESAAALHMLDQAKSVLDLALTADQRTLLKSIETYLRNVTEDVNAIREENRIHYQDLKDDLLSIKADKAETSKSQEKAKLLDWLSQVNYSSNFHTSLSPTLEDDASGAWFINGKPFQDWKFNLDSRGLLLTGISGAGKTVLCSKAIRNLLQDDIVGLHNPIIAYFFFDFNDVAKQSVEGMVRSLIFQLTAQLDEIPDELQTLYSDYRSNTFASRVPSLQDWCNILKYCLRSAKTRYIFVDALDECEEEEGHLLSDTLELLFRHTHMAIKWFLSCRPSQRAVTMLQAAGFVHSSMGTQVVDSDIRNYLSTKLEKDPRLKSFGPLAKDLIVSQISSKSSGMFRFAQCQLDSLAKLKDRRLRKVEAVLKTMPGDISSMYKRVLIDLQKSEDWLVVERVLTLVSYSARPVTLAEVTEFAILEDDMTTIRPDERFEDFSEIISLIGSLVNFQDGNLTLAHKSVQDFMVTLQLEGEYPSSGLTNLLNQGADGYIAKRCLQYLGFPQKPARDIPQDPSVKDPNSRHLARLLVEYPFLNYAASRWPHHLRTKELQSRLVAQMKSTLPFTVRPNLWKAWLMLQRVDIWETQLQLARLLCEALVRSTLVPGWTYGFWQARQRYRVTHHLAKPSVTALKSRSHEDLASSADQISAFIANCEALLTNVQGSAEAPATSAKISERDSTEASKVSETGASFYVRALYTNGNGPLSKDQLPFWADDLILVVEQQNANTWKGSLNGRTGFFSASLVKRCDENLPLEFTGGLYYDLAAVLLEVALKKGLSTDLERLLAITSSEKDLKILLGRLEFLIIKAANILGGRYGSIVREALSNIKYAKNRQTNDMYEMQDYAMEMLHSPLQQMLESGFRASRSLVEVLQGNTTKSKVGTKGPAPPQSYSVPPPLLPAQKGGMYSSAHAEFQAARFTAPPERVVGHHTTYEYAALRSTTAVSYSETVQSGPRTFEEIFANSGRSSAPTVSHFSTKHEVNTSVLKTVTEIPIHGSDKQDESTPTRRQANPQSHLVNVLKTAGKSLIKHWPTKSSVPIPILLNLPVLSVYPPGVPFSDDQRLVALEMARHTINASEDRGQQIKWAEDTLNFVDIAMLEKIWVAGPQPPNLESRKRQIQELQDDARKIILLLADQYDHKAELLKGICLEFGKLGCDVNKKAASDCYHVALWGGNARAAYRIGLMFEFSGKSVEALEYYQKGVVLDDSASLYRLGSITILGNHGQVQDYQRGISLIRRSAETADENAPQGAYIYGMLLARKLPQMGVPEMYLAKDFNAPRDHIKRAAFLGLAKAQLEMARAYQLGELNCGFNPALSLHYSLLAASQDDHDAEMLVSKWFLTGADDQFEKNEAAAFIYAQRAAQAGLAVAEFAMGYFYDKGIHVAEDLDVAFGWYSKAAAKGLEDAKSGRNRIGSMLSLRTETSRVAVGQ